MHESLTAVLLQPRIVQASSLDLYALTAMNEETASEAAQNSHERILRSEIFILVWMLSMLLDVRAAKQANESPIFLFSSPINKFGSYSTC